MAMSVLKKENEFLETREAIKPAMFRVLCPYRAGCPYYGEIKSVGKKRRCYGRLFDLADTNTVVWFRYRCQRTKQVMVIKQMGSKMLFWDEADQHSDSAAGIPDVFYPIRCPVCGQRILDVYVEVGGCLLEFKCPTHRDIVIWYGPGQGHWRDNDKNAVSA